MTTGVVVPIRGFADAKSRLAPYLSVATRARLVQAMADRVVTVARPFPVVVVSSAPEVIAWASGLRVPTLPDPGDLDGAAAVGKTWHTQHGAQRIVIVHADLPLIETLDTVVAPGGRGVAVVVPCRHEDGTPVLSLPAEGPFEFAYGPGSFDRHVEEARRRGLEVVELRDEPGLRHDVDSVDDLEALAAATVRNEPFA